MDPSLDMNACSQIRPWVRFWARFVDDLVLMLAMMPFLYQFENEGASLPHLLVIIFTSAIYILLEAGLLATWGYTPGKWLFNVSVRRPDGGKLSFSWALNRAFSVWFVGRGFNLPVLSLILPVMAYNRLKKAGKTYWDSVCGIEVRHKRVGAGAVIVTIALSVVSFVVAVWPDLSRMYW